MAYFKTNRYAPALGVVPVSYAILGYSALLGLFAFGISLGRHRLLRRSLLTRSNITVCRLAEIGQILSLSWLRAGSRSRPSFSS